MLAAALAVALSGCTGGGTPEPAPPAPAGTEAAPAEPLLSVPDIAGGMTEVVVDPGFLDTLAAAGLTPGVVGLGGYAGGSRTFSFPVTGGELTVHPPDGEEPRLQGEVRHDGSGLSLTSGSTTVAFTDLALDAAESVVVATVTVDGTVVAERAPVLATDPAGLAAPGVDDAAGTAVLRGLPVTLTPEGAELLNQAHPGESLDPSAPVGQATLTLDRPQPAASQG